MFQKYCMIRVRGNYIEPNPANMKCAEMGNPVVQNDKSHSKAEIKHCQRHNGPKVSNLQLEISLQQIQYKFSH